MLECQAADESLCASFLYTWRHVFACRQIFVKSVEMAEDGKSVKFAVSFILVELYNHFVVLLYVIKISGAH